MWLQSLVVTLLVALCSVYATWTLMPAGLRRALATTLLGLPMKLPAALATRLRQAAQSASGQASGCGACGSCDAATPKRPPGAPQPISFHRRLPR